MTLPSFLIIGGMKCGSTTLYRDLLTHPRVFFPMDKEPCNLCDDHVLTDAGRQEYEALFKRASPEQLCAEASTDYTKLPDRQGVAERAFTVLGPELRVIYLVRDPIKRLISHHHHEYSRGEMPADIGEAVERYPSLVNYSRYAMQLEPWFKTFGSDNVRVVRFEDYIADRPAVVASVESFLGLDPRPELVEVDRVHNKSDGKPVARGAMGRLIRSAPYRRLVRPLIPLGLRGWVQRRILPKAPPRPDPPPTDLVRQILEQLSSDRARLEAITPGPSPGFRADAANASTAGP